MDEPKVAVLRHYASPYYDPQKVMSIICVPEN